jgi:hypothetical protein
LAGAFAAALPFDINGLAVTAVDIAAGRGAALVAVLVVDVVAVADGHFAPRVEAGGDGGFRRGKRGEPRQERRIMSGHGKGEAIVVY